MADRLFKSLSEMACLTRFSVIATLAITFILIVSRSVAALSQQYCSNLNTGSDFNQGMTSTCAGGAFVLPIIVTTDIGVHADGRLSLQSTTFISPMVPALRRARRTMPLPSCRARTAGAPTISLATQQLRGTATRSARALALSCAVLPPRDSSGILRSTKPRPALKGRRAVVRATVLRVVARWSVALISQNLC